MRKLPEQAYAADLLSSYAVGKRLRYCKNAEARIPVKFDAYAHESGSALGMWRSDSTGGARCANQIACIPQG